MTIERGVRCRGTILELDEFLESAGELTMRERETILEEALTRIDSSYAHLPLRRAVHAVDPVHSLTLLRHRVGELTEREFHEAMIGIFRDLRDPNADYILPAPYNSHIAFLPFTMKEYYDAEGGRHFVVSRTLSGMTHASFGPGVEITRWNGVPIDRAVAINTDREAGGKEAARHVRGLDAMTFRPMAMSLPPDAGLITIVYLSDGTEMEIRVPWRVFRPDPGARATATDMAGEATSAIGLDLNLELTNLARKALFVEGAARLGALLSGARLGSAGSELDTSLFQNGFLKLHPASH